MQSVKKSINYGIKGILMHRILALLSFIIFLPSVIPAQNDSLSFSFTGLNIQYGYIIPHSIAIEAVSNTNPLVLGITRSRLNTSYQGWKVFNTYSVSGFQARYINFQNPEIVGSAFDISFFAEPLISYGKNYLISVKGGGGVSYHTKIYEPVDNPTNQFFSTRINFPLYMNVSLRFKVAGKVYLNLSGCYNHISNGGQKQPNYGMNFPTVSLGMEYFDRPIPQLKKEYSSHLKIVKPGVFMLIETLSGYRVVEASDGFPEKGTFAFGLHTRIAKQITPSWSLNAGGEFILDGFIKETLRRDQEDIDYKRFAFTAGQDFLLGRVIFTQYLGFYVYSPYKAKNRVYQKYEIAYRISDNLLVGVFLKAHTSDAELLGISMSYMLKRKHVLPR